jgi:putative tricarboxylic transport membrane protein
MEPAKRNRRDLFAGIFFSLLGLAVVVESFRLQVGTPTHPKAGFMPFLGGATLIVLCVVLIVKSWLKPGEDSKWFGDLRRPALFAAGLILYAGVLEYIGYVLATVFLGTLVLLILGLKPWRSLIMSLILSAGTYILFSRILGVELPAGILSFLF